MRPRLLVADDHRAMLDTLVRMLSPEFEVVAAVGDGLSVVTQAEQLAPDLLVLDIAMPELSGIAAAARLKERGSTAKLIPAVRRVLAGGAFVSPTLQV